MKKILRNIIKHSFCTVGYYSGLAELYLKFWIKRQKQFPLLILTYHRFLENLDNEIETDCSTVHVISEFQKEMRFLKKHFSVLSLNDATKNLVENKVLTKPMVVITVDDGYKDNYDILFPVLKQEKIPAIIYLTTGAINTEIFLWTDEIRLALVNTKKKQISVKGLTWSLESLKLKQKAYMEILELLKNFKCRERLDAVTKINKQLEGVRDENNREMLNWQEIKEMQESGLVTFGAHTCTHPILSKMPFTEVKEEIRCSKVMIENKLDVSVEHFAYPNGNQEDFSEDIASYCKDLGFQTVATMVYGKNCTTEDILRLKRIYPSQPLSVFVFNLLKGLHS